MALLDLLGRRGVARDLGVARRRVSTFRELQRQCGAISSSVLNDRLAELRAAGIVESADGGYRLTNEGSRLLELYPPLQAWAERWARRERAERVRSPRRTP